MVTKTKGKRHAMRAGLNGAADITGVYTCRGVGIRFECELKNVKTPITEDQILYGKAVTRCGCIYVCYRCETGDMAKEVSGCVTAVKLAISKFLGDHPWLEGEAVDGNAEQRKVG